MTVSGLNRTQLLTVDASGFLVLNHLTSTQIPYVSPTAVVAQLSYAQLCSKDANGSPIYVDLKGAQVSALTQTQLGQFTQAQIETLDASGFTLGQLSYIDVKGVALLLDLNTEQVQKIPCSVFGQLSGSQLSDIASNISTKQAPWIAAQQIMGMLPVAFSKMAGMILANLNEQAIEAISALQMGNIDCSGNSFGIFVYNRSFFFTSTAASGITAPQVASLTGLEFAQFSLDAIDGLSTAAVGAISGDQLFYWGETRIQALGTNFQHLSSDALLGLTDGAWAYPTQVQIWSIPLATLKAMQQAVFASPVSAACGLVINLSSDQIMGLDYLITCLSTSQAVQLIENLNGRKNSLNVVSNASIDVAILKVIEYIGGTELLDTLVGNENLYDNLDASVQFYIEQQLPELSALTSSEEKTLNDSIRTAEQGTFTASMNAMQSALNSTNAFATLMPTLTLPNLASLNDLLKQLNVSLQVSGKLNDKISQIGVQEVALLKQSLSSYIDSMANTEAMSTDVNQEDVTGKINALKATLAGGQNLVTLGRTVSLLCDLASGISALVADLKTGSASTQSILTDVGMLLNGIAPITQSIAQFVFGGSAIGNTVLGKSIVGSKAISWNNVFTKGAWSNVWGSGGDDVGVTGSVRNSARAVAGVNIAVNIYNLAVASYTLNVDVQKGDKLAVAEDGLTVAGSSLILLANLSDMYLAGWDINASLGWRVGLSSFAKALNISGCMVVVTSSLIKEGVALNQVINDDSLSPNVRTLLEGYYGSLILLDCIEFVAVVAYPEVGGSIVASVVSAYATIFSAVISSVVIEKTVDDRVSQMQGDERNLASSFSSIGLITESNLATYLSNNDLLVPNMINVAISTARPLRWYSLFYGLVNWYKNVGEINASSNDYFTADKLNFDYTDTSGKGWGDGNSVDIGSGYGLSQSDAITTVLGYLIAQAEIDKERIEAQSTAFFSNLQKALTGGFNSDTTYVYTNNANVSMDVNCVTDTAFSAMVQGAITGSTNIELLYLWSIVSEENKNPRFIIEYTSSTNAVLEFGLSAISSANVVYFVVSNPRDTIANNDFVAATLVNSASTATTTDEVFVGAPAVSATQNISYIIEENTVAVLENTATQATFIDYSIHDDYLHYIYGVWGNIYISHAAIEEGINSQLLLLNDSAPDGLTANTVHYIINNAFSSSLPTDDSSNLNQTDVSPIQSVGGLSLAASPATLYGFYYGGVFVQCGDWTHVYEAMSAGAQLTTLSMVISITELYNMSIIYGPSLSGDYSVIIGAQNNPDNTDYLIAQNSETLVLAGESSILAAQNGGTLVGSSASSTSFEIEGGNVDIYGFSGAAIYNYVNFAGYLTQSRNKNVTITDLSASGCLAGNEDVLMGAVGYTFSPDAMLQSRADYTVSVDGAQQSIGSIYNASTYKLGDDNATISLGSDGAGVVFEDTMGGLTQADWYARNITLSGSGDAVALGYGDNSVNVSGLGSSISFSDSLVGSNGLATDTTATSSDYRLAYNTCLTDISQLSSSSDTSTLDLAGATGSVEIDDTASKNTNMELSLQSSSENNLCLASISLRESASCDYVINDYYDDQQPTLKIFLDPYAGNLQTCFNLYSNVVDLAAASVAVNFLGMGKYFDLDVNGRDIASIYSMSDLATSNATVGVGLQNSSMMINLQGVTSAGVTTTSSTYVSFQ